MKVKTITGIGYLDRFDSEINEFIEVNDIKVISIQYETIKTNEVTYMHLAHILYEENKN